MTRAFAKYEGLGNDFVVLDASVWPESEVSPELARVLCDRHRGIGGDGVLWVAKGERPGEDARLVILNADGSRPEMCGNGVRCVAAWLNDEGRLEPDATLKLVTDAGLRPARVVAPGSAGRESMVQVDMGTATVAPEPIAVDAGASLRVQAWVVDVGNPHAVVFDRVPEEALMDVVRAVTARTDVYPRGVNVEFVAQSASGAASAGASVDVRVHERGVGWTQACGTGAVAVAAASVVRGFAGARAGERVRVALPGGPLWITATSAGPQGVFATEVRGPARKVFRGALEPGEYAPMLAAGSVRGSDA